LQFVRTINLLNTNDSFTSRLHSAFDFQNSSDMYSVVEMTDWLSCRRRFGRVKKTWPVSSFMSDA